MVDLRAGFALTLLAAANLTACLENRALTGESYTGPLLVRTGPTEACVVQGGAARLKAVVTDLNGNPYTAESISWSTSDARVAQVSGGVVTGIGPGNAVITAGVRGWFGHSSLWVRRGFVSFVIDDGHSSDWSMKRPIFEEKGAVASVAIVSGWSGVRQTSDSELRSLVNLGWEVLAHSRTHIPEDTLNVGQLKSQIQGAQEDLAARGFSTRIHVYPYGAHSTTTEMVVRENFDAALTAGGGFNRLPITDWFAIRRINLGTAYARPGQNTLAFYKGLVDSTRIGGHWLIFMIHELASVDSANLRAVLDYSHNLGLPILTVSQGLAQAHVAPPMACAPGSLTN